jgi:pimeloyl-ACP methyl ester carboxylesterase
MSSKILISGIAILAAVTLSLNCSDKHNDFITSSDGVKISFVEQGRGETSILFVHGWSNDKSIWDDQMSHFAGKYRTVALDLPGFGESGDNRINWTISAFGEDVATVIEKLNLNQVVLVGFSMGTAVVIEAANRLEGRISGVVLVDDLHNVEMKIPPAMESYLDSVFMDMVTYPTNEKLMAGGFYKKNSETSFKRVLSMLDGPSRVGWQESLYGYIQWINDNCTQSLKTLNVPIVAINSERQPTDVEVFRKYVPSFEAHIIQDAGHLLMWDAPEEFNRYLEATVQEMPNH